MNKADSRPSTVRCDNNCQKELSSNTNSLHCLPSFLLNDLGTNNEELEEEEEEIEANSAEEEQLKGSFNNDKLCYSQCSPYQVGHDQLHPPARGKFASFDTLDHNRKHSFMLSPYKMDSSSLQYAFPFLPQPFNQHASFQFVANNDYRDNFKLISPRPQQYYSMNLSQCFPNQPTMINGSLNGYGLASKKKQGSKFSKSPVEMNRVESQQQQQAPNYFAPLTPSCFCKPIKRKKHKKSNKASSHPVLSLAVYLNLSDKDLYSYIITQKGSREMQAFLSKSNENEIEALISKLNASFPDIMNDKYGNYFSQKLIQICSYPQRIALLDIIYPRFVEISCNSFGTHPLQSLIEIVNLPKELALLCKCIRTNEVTLSLDAMGTHVLQKFISCTTDEQREQIDLALLDSLDKLINDSYGVCVLTKLMKHSTSFKLKERIAEYISHNNPLSLIQGPFSNYVVQELFNKVDIVLCKALISVILANFLSLSLQKYSSNVVENCIRYAEEEVVLKIYSDILSKGEVDSLLSDTYGGFVMEKLLSRLNKDQKAEIIKEVKKSDKGLNLSNTIQVLLYK